MIRSGFVSPIPQIQFHWKGGRALLLGLLSLLIVAAVQASTGGGYTLTWYSIDGGGTTSTGGSYALRGSIGQPDASAALTGGAYNLRGGFQNLPQAPAGTLPPANTNLIANGDFSGSLAATWGFWNATTATPGGVLEIHRNTGTPDGGFYQFVAFNFPAFAPVQLTFEMGNRSAVTKQVNMIVRRADWSELRSCWFVVPANSPTQTYTMQFTTTGAWSPLVLQGWLQEADGIPALRIDNIDLQYRPSASYIGTTCTTAPPANVNLVFDGGFNFGFSNWGIFGSPFAQVVPVGGNLALELARYGGSGDGGFFQFNPYSAPPGGTWEYTFRLGNRSPVFKSVNMLVRRADWTENRSCVINLPANSPMSSYIVRFRTNSQWANLVIQGFVLQADGSPAVQFDDLNLQYRPGLIFGGDLQCPPLADQPFEVDASTTLPEDGLVGEGGIAPLPTPFVLPPDAIVGEGGIAPLPTADASGLTAEEAKP